MRHDPRHLAKIDRSRKGQVAIVESPLGHKKGLSMKRYGHIYEKVCDKENVRAAILKASKGKRSRPDVRKILSNKEYYVELLHKRLVEESYHFSDYTPGIVCEGAARKERKIFKPNFYPDQILHWALMLQLSPIIKRGMYEFTCGSIPGRGVHYGKKYVRRWLDRDRRNTKYYLKMDIKKFYPSVNIPILLNKINRKVKDQRAIRMIDEMLSKAEGLPIGILASQWFANFYLQDLDHYIKQHLRAKYYIRYMDDMVIFGPNKRDLHHMKTCISEFLNDEKLCLKGNWQVCRLDLEPLDFMGFRFYRDKTTLRRSIMLRISRKARKINREQRVSYRDSAAMISYLGWVKHSDSFWFYKKWIATKIEIKKLKAMIRRRSKCKEEEVNPQCSPKRLT